MNYDEILAKITPQDGSAQEKAKTIVETIQKAAPKTNVQLGGSLAKDTFLANSHDCDIFVKFDYNTHRTKDISAELETILKKLPFKISKVHGSRDYFQFEHDNLQVEVVPVLDIDDWSKAKNVTDMSPLHVDWVLKNIQGTHLANDIRLAKQFCKAQRVYGAESYIGGFSGHVLDILMIEYGGFEALLSAALHWSGQVVIDTEEFYKKNDAVSQMNDSKTQSPIIVVDPIMPERNAASALTQEKLTLFTEAASEFLKKPQASFFEMQPFVPPKNSFVIMLDPQEGKTDVIAGKCKKVIEYIQTIAKQNDFAIIDSDWDYNEKAVAYFVVKDSTLSSEKEFSGPPLKMDSACKAFKKEHKTVTEKNGKLLAIEKRKFVKFEELLSHLKKSEYVTDRVASFNFESQ